MSTTNQQKDIISKQYMIKKAILGLIGAILLVALDQWTKLLAITHLKGQEAFVIWDGVFELHYLENHGAAFGILQGKQTFFIISTIIVLLAIVYVYLKKIPNEPKFRFLNLIAVLYVAGALGNFIDRVMNNYVVDFFYFSLIDFPIFNVADIYVVVATIGLMLLILFYYKEEDYNKIFPSKKEKS